MLLLLIVLFPLGGPETGWQLPRESPAELRAPQPPFSPLRVPSDSRQELRPHGGAKAKAKRGPKPSGGGGSHVTAGKRPDRAGRRGAGGCAPRCGKGRAGPGRAGRAAPPVPPLRSPRLPQAGPGAPQRCPRRRGPPLSAAHWGGRLSYRAVLIFILSRSCHCRRRSSRSSRPRRPFVPGAMKRPRAAAGKRGGWQSWRPSRPPPHRSPLPPRLLPQPPRLAPSFRLTRGCTQYKNVLSPPPGGTPSSPRALPRPPLLDIKPASRRAPPLSPSPPSPPPQHFVPTLICCPPPPPSSFWFPRDSSPTCL